MYCVYQLQSSSSNDGEALVGLAVMKRTRNARAIVTFSMMYRSLEINHPPNPRFLTLNCPLTLTVPISLPLFTHPNSP
ncbi:hypothetical protein E2C01_061256 [Portunus trituberculatus]|uniref:Uncharacterized protein n=1 Tax=Portunus trituberculatus TaxID=210409 RepID=A0A5B7H3D6_PORTR|nr:hypothetical protein [Portunus trituberculatus]